MQAFDGTFELIDPRDIHFDPRYQRPQKWDLIAAIAAEPTWEAFGCPVCAKRLYAGDTIWALDGQQRINGLLAAAEPPMLIPVIWWAVASVRDEAALFDKINTNRKNVASIEKFRSRLTAEHTTYVRIAAAVERAGFTIGQNQESAKTIAAISSLEALYNAVGEEGTTIVLEAIALAWPDEVGGTSSTMLRSIAEVAGEASASNSLTVEKLSKAFTRTTPGRLNRKAEEIRYAQGGSKGAALRKAFKSLAKI
jgi:hypothetical protein